MRRLLALLAALPALALCAAPAIAAQQFDWSTYKSFANTRCEAPKTIADMKQSAKGLRYNDGSYVFPAASLLKVLGVKTIRATANTLACRVKVSVEYAGSARTITGTYTVHIFPNGDWNTNLDQAY